MSIEGKTQGEAAGSLGCSKSRLSYLHKEALALINDSLDYQARLDARARRRPASGPESVPGRGIIIPYTG